MAVVPSSTMSTRRGRFGPSGRRYKDFHVVGAFLLGCCFATTAISIFHFSTLGDLHDGSVVSSPAALVHHPGNVAMQDEAASAKHHEENNNNDVSVQQQAQQQVQVQVQQHVEGEQKLAGLHHNAVHPVAGLDCSAHGGPMEIHESEELVYWRDIPKDNSYTSPFQKTNGERQYLSFEPDAGGFNNIRMSMETVVTMAVAMGRVLVLPPSQNMYLLGQAKFNFADFFPLQETAQEHAGLEIISMEQYLTETLGKTLDTKTHEVSFPPGKKTAWDGDTMGIRKELSPWIRSIALMPGWDPNRCIAVFPKSTDPQDAIDLQFMFDEILAEDNGVYASRDAPELFVNKPTAVDAPTKDRLREFISQQHELCIYDATLQEAPLIHFHGKPKKAGLDDGGGSRLLVHFYAFLFFQDWKEDLWTKRFVRDHVRYIDDIQCAAARVVDKLRNDHKYGGGSGPSANTYDSFHIRRGDFQYKNTRVDASVIVERSRDVIGSGGVVYVGTDERDKSFFQPLKDAGWTIYFLDDFLDVIGPDIDPHYYGMIDQLIVSRGDKFFGCWFSTFTGYIMRLRGYHSQAEISNGGPNAEAFREGKLPNSYYYATEDNKLKMHDYWPVKQSFYAREFPVSWRQLDVE